MKLKIERERDARAIAAALGQLYPAYRFEAKQWPRDKGRWSIPVYCNATGALLRPTAEV